MNSQGMVSATDMDLQGARAVVLGAGRSGLAAARALVRHGAKVALSDAKPLAELAAAAAEAAELGFQLAPGGHPEALLDGIQLVVLSPGVPNRLPFVVAARQRGAMVMSEIELAFRLAPRRWLAVTGTNGKTTTTYLLHHLFTTAGEPALLGGNIGQALADRVEDAPEHAPVVAELSSFQLEDIQTFKPAVALWTNLTPDHLDRYPNLEAYGVAKARIFENMDRRDHLVFNAMDPIVEKLCSASRAQLWRFARGTEQSCGAWEKDGRLYWREPGGQARFLLEAKELAIRGPHNLENALAAAVAALAFGLAPDAVVTGLRSFRPVEHRLEPAGSAKGVGFVNDSKATNVDSVAKALQSFDQKVHLILGGKDKKGDFTALSRLIQEKVAAIYTIGQAAETVEAQLKGVAPLQSCGDLETAMRRALAAAGAGEWVLLSPGCASFDQFKDFEHRGRRFKEIAAQLAGEVLS